MNRSRRLWDRIFLSDHEWKKKYCPTLAKWVLGSHEDRHKMWLKIVGNAKKNRICPVCHGIYWDDDCPECNGCHVCGGYELQVGGAK